MNPRERAVQFAALHRCNDPLILFNAWDAGSARAVAASGASAIATGSWSVAAAHGFEDGEALPFAMAVANLERIVASVDVPVTLDMEGGYAEALPALQENVRRVIEAGAVGINFEDRIVAGAGLYSMDKQCERIRAIREAAEQAGVPLFINARTDLFLATDAAKHDAALLSQAIERAQAYAESGASGFFAPALGDLKNIKTLCAQSPLPVNIMMLPNLQTRALVEAGVARISYGPAPYRQAMKALEQASKAALDWR